MKAELAEEEAKAQYNTAKVLLRSDAAAAAADIVSVENLQPSLGHADLSVSPTPRCSQHHSPAPAVLMQEEGESLRQRNEATTTALMAASEALGECQAQLANYESQVRCLTSTGPAGHAGTSMTGADVKVPADPLSVSMVVWA
jgi:hypothetical protein